MSYQFNNFYRGQYCKWRWPMQIGVINQSEHERKNMIANYWSGKFCNVENINEQNKLYNFIYAECDLNEVAKSIQSSGAKAILILIQVDESIFNDPIKLKESESILLSLSYHTESFAALLFNTSLSLNEWTNRFTIELCHNRTIREALESTTNHVVGFYDHELDTYATLNFLFKKTIRILEDERSNFPDTYAFKSKFIHASALGIDELIAELEIRLQYAQYNHESDEATGLAEILTSVNETLGLDIADTREFYASAPPMSSGAEPNEDDSNNNEFEDDAESIPLDEEEYDADIDEELISGAESSPAPAPPSPSPSIDIKDLIDKIDNYIPPIDKDIDDKYLMQVEDVFDITGRGTVAPSPASQIPLEKPRYLQSTFRDISNNPIDVLFQSNAYKLVVRIGEFNRKWTQSKTDSFPTEKVFQDPLSTKETIMIQIKDNISKTIQSTEITLNKVGDSNEAIFIISTDNISTLYTAEIFAYHRDRLIQKATLTAPILSINDNPDISDFHNMVVDLKLVSDLENLSHRTEFNVSIGSNTQPQIDEPIVGISESKPLLKLTFSSALEKLMKKIKDKIQNAAINVDDFPEDLYAEENQTLLLQLALDGNDLYMNHVKEQISIKGPIQIISYKDEFIPFDFVYTYPAPHKDAVVCEKAAESLLAGTCCGCDAIKKSPCDLICPFGFLGFREIIEHHVSQPSEKKDNCDYIVLAEPGKQRKPLSIMQHTMYASSDKVFAAKPTLLQDIQTAFKQNTQHSIEVESWKEWSTKIQNEKPDSLILMVHIEPDEKTQKFQIEIGNADFLGKNHFNESMIHVKNSSINPFVMLIGCEAVNMDEYGFDLSSQLMTQGAAMVMSNFTKIRGRQAAPLVIKLLEFMKANQGKEFTLGEIVLKLRQYLLAKGIMVGFSLTTLGDADWKIKI